MAHESLRHSQAGFDADGGSRRWRRWLSTFVVLTVLGATILYIAVVAIDPYATGRFALTDAVDLANTDQRLTRGALVRDSRFNAAIIGASTSLPLDPKVIGEASRWRMAQLSLVGSLPAEQLVVARAFGRHHRSQPTLEVFGLDELWCRPDAADQNGWGGFPRWLYEGSDVRYLTNVFSPDAVETAARRIGIWLGLVVPALRADGYEPPFAKWGQVDLAAIVSPTEAAPPEAGFPAIDALAAYIQNLSRETRLVLMFEPIYRNALPVADSLADARLRECKRRVQALVKGRPDSGYLDLMNDNAISRDPANFLDGLHYRRSAAELIEQRLISTLRSNMLAPPS